MCKDLQCPSRRVWVGVFAATVGPYNPVCRWYQEEKRKSYSLGEALGEACYKVLSDNG